MTQTQVSVPQLMQTFTPLQICGDVCKIGITTGEWAWIIGGGVVVLGCLIISGGKKQYEIRSRNHCRF
jgi:hypothetical protein